MKSIRAQFILIQIHLITLIATILCISTVAFADTKECLVQSKYEIIRWNKNWGKDKLDNQELYRITNTRAIEYMGKKVVQLELLALDSTSRVSLRNIAVEDGRIAKQICKSIRTGPGDTRRIIKSNVRNTISRKSRKRFSRIIKTAKDFSVRRPNSSRVSSSALVKKSKKRLKFPYIHHLRTGWIRANPPEYGDFTTCSVLKRKFSCLDKHKQQFGSELRILERELTATAGI